MAARLLLRIALDGWMADERTNEGTEGPVSHQRLELDIVVVVVVSGALDFGRRFR